MSIASIQGLPRVQPVLELGIGDSRSVDISAEWDVAEWDEPTDQWSGVEPYWVDVTCFGHEMETFTGHERTTEVWEIGTARVLLDNRSGWADYPPTVASEYVLAVRPSVQIRAGVKVDGEYHCLWRGFVDEANPGYSPELGETVELVCIDAKGESGRGELAKRNLNFSVTNKVLTSNVATLTVGAHSAVVGDTIVVSLSPADAVFDGQYVVTTVGATNLSYAKTNANVASAAAGGSVTVVTTQYIHERIDDILDVQYWPAEWRDLEASGIELVATEFGQPAVDAINRASDSGGGAVFGDIDGKVTHRNYGWQGWSPDEPADGSIGNVASDDVCPTGWEMSFRRADFSNRVLIGRADMEEPLMFEDVQDRVDYGVEPFTITDLQTSLTSEMESLADRILQARNFDLAPRVAAVGLNAATGDDVVDLLATVDPRNPSRVLCRHKGTDGRLIFNKMCFVTGIRHTITPFAWEARLSLDDASPWAIGLTHAEWDVDQWDQEQWAP